MSFCREISVAVLLSAAVVGHAQDWTATKLHSTEARALAVDAWQIVGHTGAFGDERAVLWTLPDLKEVNLHPAGAEASVAQELSDGRQVGWVLMGGLRRAASWTGTNSFVDMHPTGAEESAAFCANGALTGGAVVIDQSSRASLWPSVGTQWLSLHDPAQVSSSVNALADGCAGGSMYSGFAVSAAFWVLGNRGWQDYSIAGYTNDISGIHAGQQVGSANTSTNSFSKPVLWRNTPSGGYLSGFGRGSDVYGAQQCGNRLFDESYRWATVWQSTALAIDLHEFLPAGYSDSSAEGIWDDGEQFTYVVGRAWDLQFNTDAFLWKTANILTSAISSLNIATGSVVSGDLTSIEHRDDERLVLRPGPVLSGIQSPIEMIAEGIAPTSIPGRVSFSIEAHSSSSQVTLTIAFFNYSTKEYESLKTVNLALADKVFRLDQTLEQDRFLEPGTNKVRVKISFRSNGPAIAYPWEVRIDKAWWHMFAFPS